MNVAPVPPNSPTSDMLKVREWAGWPPASRTCRFSAWLARRIGSMPGWTIEGPWTPMNQKNAVAAWIRIRPG